MRNIYTVLFLLFFVSQSQAQFSNWLTQDRLITGDSIMLFSEENNIPFYPIMEGNVYGSAWREFLYSDDSIKIHGSKITHFPYRSLARDLEQNCPVAFGSSWMGDSILVHLNTKDVLLPIVDSVFFYFDGAQSFKILPNAVENDAWVAGSISDTVTISASVDKIWTVPVLSVPVEVKYFILNVETEDPTVDHLWNNRDIRLSENYGILQFFELGQKQNIPHLDYEIGLIGTPKIGHGARNLTTRKVWAIYPNDEIHHFIYEKQHDYLNNQTRDTIFTILKYVDRIETDTSLILVHEERIKHIQYYNDTIQFDTTSYALKETVINPWPISFLDSLPHQSANLEYPMLWSFMTQFQYPNIADIGTRKSKSWEHYSFYGDGDTCLNEFVVDGYLCRNYYIEGLGKWDRVNCNSWLGNDRRTGFVYIKQEGVEWGDPLTFSTSTNKINDFAEVHIYPNPVADQLTIDADFQKYYRAEMYSLDGKLISTKDDLFGVSTIDVSNFDKGIFVIKIVSENKLIGIKRFIKL